MIDNPLMRFNEDIYNEDINKLLGYSDIALIPKYIYNLLIMLIGHLETI